MTGIVDAQTRQHAVLGCPCDSPVTSCSALYYLSTESFVTLAPAIARRLKAGG
jgi:hypothetical protein